jgi:glucose-6-phosphatase
MNTLYSASVPFIHHLQLALAPVQTPIISLSSVLDPKYAFSVLAPLAYAFDESAGRLLLWTAVLVEWANMLLKGMLHGQRPFWYVHIAPDAAQLPPLQQFAGSCETGPGSPSGHSMAISALYVQTLILLYTRTKCSRRTRLVGWMSCICTLTLLSASRIYLAAHFPHQCALGITLGVLTAALVRFIRPALDRLTRLQYVLIAFALTGSALTLRWLLPVVFHIPSDWSEVLAKAHCLRPDWVHVQTTPLYSMTRYVGALLGFGLGIHSPATRALSRLHFTTRMRCASAALSIALAQAFEILPRPPSDYTYTMYAYGLITAAAFSFTFTALVPLMVAKCTPRPMYRKTSSIEHC